MNRRFLNSVSNNIPLEDTRKVVKAFCSDQNADIRATLTELVDKQLCNQYGHGIRFLFEVWGKSGRLFCRPLMRTVKQCHISSVQVANGEPGYAVIYVLDPADAKWNETNELVFHIDCFSEEGEKGACFEIRDFNEILCGLKSNET